MRNLYIVATPIGNLKDITLRALEILKEVDVILAEDTRVTRKLLSHYNIRKPIFRYVSSRDFSNFRQIALVTDAGTPAISDPGRKLVKDLSAKGFTVIPVPGASALSAIASASDINLSKFLFLGFPPAKKGRRKFFEMVSKSKTPIILFESPHRILKTLSEIYQAAGERYLNVGRELTKIHEEVFRGKLSEAISHFKGERERGEFVVVVDSK
ncbi:16S rRNA (cytidine(1402)-2'-O)-methyltransferase [Candidatus Giovannonibacteria bacterium RIFCSPHIGHO2_01_FULL_48_47]|nr:MAG: Ribosomal RNA small subunit methyltransferase I [Parcubacteria group bacterium GW2011_GWF2_50_9]OGF65840.1 MAG: 16S rRNA (cytidine(1402)-2'-O)-methyltransferase [Candidatus Giovannonibacteria bacterium RIFCSPHIGHO2_01_FULL_48_47]OGF69060.1 MAG: 16S rRNA (cytidine(1402)-2'-O)-methyltransferase [Candidatus Giovannonibacteria bacterium RIFCSPHIGHO2_02_FULL_48_15]OGF87962.1 MAG: 16S rRNA (cytidine(1402)-2'-O)-methyltransferase [Candidatus Giovannonibacteria bacterium RIFCSPLOWO2_01_FULL_48_4